MTRKATWLTTSGITGLTLPGMIEEPACTAGRRISPMPVRGPLDSRRRSLQIFDSLTAMRFSTPENKNEGAHVGGRLDQVGGRHQRLAGDARQLLDRERGVARIGVDAGADRGGAEIDLAEQSRGLRSRAMSSFMVVWKRVELLAERHRHGVLQLGAAHLQDVVEFDRLGLEGVGEFVAAPAPAARSRR